MNRRDVYPDIVGVRVPRTRGDEPYGIGRELKKVYAFPAHAGMNRTRTTPQRSLTRVPRTRGDEPGKWSPDVLSA